tara:strand:- start:517 stop:1041 length:525 start_codon:yes stop_codon:yes gene_type:complete
MAILGVDDFKAKLVGGGARSNLFKVTLNFPSYAEGDVELTSFMAKGSQLPASTIAKTELDFRGRKVSFAGDRTFEDWTVTIINDTGFEIRNALERWMDGMGGHTVNTGLTNPTDYKADGVVEQLDKDGSILKRYDFRGAFPTSLAAQALAYDTEGIQEFEVTFAYDYWESNTTS